eukprot:gene18134-24574_t
MGHEHYREAVRIMEGNKKDIDTDPLLRLHTLHNLAQLLGPNGDGVQGVARTLRDSALQEEAEAIRKKYMETRAVQLAVHHHDYSKLVNSANPFGRKGGWCQEALRLLSTDAHRGAEVSQAIRSRLSERDQYRLPTEVNASSLATRFRNLSGLGLLLADEMAALEKGRALVMTKIDELQRSCQDPSREFIEQAGHCHRCRSELGVRGHLCEHCKLEEQLIMWEVRLFSLDARALAAGVNVSAEDAARRALTLARDRVGRGGLNEATLEGGEDSEVEDFAGPAHGRRNDGTATALAKIKWNPSETEQVSFFT